MCANFCRGEAGKKACHGPCRPFRTILDWLGYFLIVFLNLVGVLSFIKKKRAKQLHLRGYKRLKAETNPAAKETTTQTPQQVARLFQQVLGELG
jgi:hypothetical protein